MQDSLIGYLVGALDEEETARLELMLQNDPRLREQLLRAARGLNLLKRDPDDIEPPPGLARNTCQFVRRASQVVPAAAYERPPSPTGWSMIDLVIAAGIFLAACLLSFPAINNSRYHAQIAGCQNNLRHLGRALIEYSENAQGLFPQVPASGNLAVAGMYAPTLREFGLVLDDRVFLCPASTELREDGEFSVPTIEEIKRARGQTLAVMQRGMGGHYGYPLGYVNHQGKLRGIPNRNRTHFALMSDTPSEPLLCQVKPRKTAGHRNVLFESGHVRQIPLRTLCWCGDQLYVNDRGKVSAGVHVGDTVIGRSGTAPLLTVSATSY